MKKFLLSLSVAMLSVVGAWAQSIDKADTSDEVGAAVRRLEVVLSGDWLGGTDVEAKTEMLIDLIMGYEDGAFDADKAFTEVTIKSAEGSTVVVNQSLIQQLISGKATEDQGQTTWWTANNKITSLDLSGIAVTEYVGHAGSSSQNVNATLYPGNSGAGPIQYLAMPAFASNDGDNVIPAYTTAYMASLRSVVLPPNAKKVAPLAFEGLNNLQDIKLNQGLVFIGNSAFHRSGVSKDYPDTEDLVVNKTLDIPSTVKYIGPDAFYNHVYTDIYFHSAQAPICPAGKGLIEGKENAMLYNDCYFGNGGFGTNRAGSDNYSTGFANRENYVSEGNRWFVMMHFPSSAELSDLDVSSYKDETRVYHKVYGNMHNSSLGELTIANVGEDLMWAEKIKNGETTWAEANSKEDVGQESSALSYGGVDTGDGSVKSGYADTYRGLNYIWPSKSQWDRAFATIANGVNWDGVTTYRPVISDEQLALMIEDGLILYQEEKEVALGSYTVESAAEYNASLPGAKHENDPKTYFEDETSVNEHNAKLPNAVKEGDSKGTYTAAEAYAENLKLPNAVQPGDERNPAEYYDADEAQEYNNSLPDAVQPGDNFYYSEEAIIENNSKLEGAKAEGSAIATEDKVLLTWEQFSNTTEWKNANHNWWGADHGEADYNALLAQYKSGAQDMQWQYSGWPRTPYAQTSDNVTFTADQANAYNETLPGAWNSTTVAGQYDVTTANEHNNKLPDAVQPGDPKGPYTADEANQKNLELPGAIQPGDSKGTYSLAEAIDFNSKLPNAVKIGDVDERWTKADADAWNADNLEGAVTAGQSNTSDPVLKDLISKQAFQGTRRCVFAANDGRGGGDYPVDVKGGYWWTICLPFDLTKAQIDKYFGEGTHVCLFNRVDRNTNPGAGKKPYVKFYFTEDQYVGKENGDVVLKAHVPYMIHPSNDDSDAASTGVKISLDEVSFKTGNPVPTVVTSNVKVENYTGDDHTEYRFIGNYDTKLPTSEIDPETGKNVLADVVVPQYSYIYAKKNGATGAHPYQFWFTQNANIKWAANKCVIQATARDGGLIDQGTFFKEDENGARQITILLDDEDSDEATAIDVIIVAGDGENSEVIYNLNGQMLNSVPQRGVYIKNGKKYIAK